MDITYAYIFLASLCMDEYHKIINTFRDIQSNRDRVFSNIIDR